MDNPLEELKRYIMNDGLSMDHSNYEGRLSEHEEIDSTYILNSIKAIADEISQIADDDDDEDDYLIYNSRESLKTEKIIEPPKRLVQRKEYQKLQNDVSTASQNTCHDRLFLDSKRMNAALQEAMRMRQEQMESEIKEKPEINK